MSQLAVIDGRRAFARAHNGHHVVQLGRAYCGLPGVATTPVEISPDGCTLTYMSRPVDSANPAHALAFGSLVRSIPAAAIDVVTGADDQGEFARWSITFGRPVFVATV